VLLASLLPVVTGAAGATPSLYLRRRLAAARRDPVTGLLTRTPWTMRAERRVLRHPALAVVLLIDVNDFKSTNDTHGHDAGDAVLAAIGQRLAQFTEGRGVAGRLGGDVFAAVVQLTGPRREVALLASELAVPIRFEGKLIPTAASVGAVRVLTLAQRTLRQALAGADRAMYEAKRNGGGWTFAEPTGQPYPVTDKPVRRVRHHGPEAAR
jgi:diguanylate cyclase (GGDEF)-like protein